MKCEKVFFNALKSVLTASGVSRKARGVENSLSSGDSAGREVGDNTGGLGNCFFQRCEMAVGKGRLVRQGLFQNREKSTRARVVLECGPSCEGTDPLIGEINHY
jgi:hypothetical protein